MFKLYEVLVLAYFNDKRVWHQIETPVKYTISKDNCAFRIKQWLP